MDTRLLNLFSHPQLSNKQYFIFGEYIDSLIDHLSDSNDVLLIIPNSTIYIESKKYIIDDVYDLNKELLTYHSKPKYECSKYEYKNSDDPFFIQRHTYLLSDARVYYDMLEHKFMYDGIEVTIDDIKTKTIYLSDKTISRFVSEFEWDSKRYFLDTFVKNKWNIKSINNKSYYLVINDANLRVNNSDKSYRLLIDMTGIKWKVSCISLHNPPLYFSKTKKIWVEDIVVII